MQALLNPPVQPPLAGAALPWPAPDDTVHSGRAPLQVTMGQLKLGARTDQLQALLGSCVGIALIWKKRGVCALAHCLLPECPQMADEFGARYVNQAVPSLLRLLGASEADHADIDVVVAGGATMLNGCSSRLQIGQQNAEAARKYLRQHSLNVVYCRVGGKCGRTLTIDCATCAYAVQEIVTTCSGATHA
ncbi:chemotaxis protein CheD [Duganella sp. 1224]|uniref:chemotaxis protein CheD n=1 Tax=Duganella sp. 1224 TaxID=2587052 RepID=UPI0015CB58E1|nr:chemotaxis protein CheD [Duganella sp. 1224]NYE60222.1 chemotaxis protein CheD [Duganella sp. 1224]